MQFACLALNIQKKGNTGSFSRINRKLNVMYMIWDGKSFEVGDHWLLWRGLKKPNDHAEPTKKYIKNSS